MTLSISLRSLHNCAAEPGAEDRLRSGQEEEKEEEDEDEDEAAGAAAATVAGRQKWESVGAAAAAAAAAAVMVVEAEAGFVVVASERQCWMRRWVILSSSGDRMRGTPW